MKRKSIRAVVISVLAGAAAGCASGIAVGSTTGNGLASSSTTIPDCRNQGSYNRAANLCVSGGP